MASLQAAIQESLESILLPTAGDEGVFRWGKETLIFLDALRIGSE